MNKEQIIKKLTDITGLAGEKCTTLNSIIEDHFLIGRHNKEKMVADIEARLDVAKAEAEKLYESAMRVIGEGLKDKLKHPFGEQK